MFMLCSLPLICSGGQTLTQHPAYGRGRSVDQAGDPTLAKAELDGDALFDAEFVISHRGNTWPFRYGVPLRFYGPQSYRSAGWKALIMAVPWRGFTRVRSV
jgi:hypothetical protein